MEITALADLLDLQEIDLAIDRLLHKRETLPELAPYRETHEALTEASGRRERSAARLRELELAEDKAEGELSILEAKLTEHETRLYAGGMSGRETEHMRLEVQALRGQREALEERTLAMLEEIEPVRGELEGIDAEISELASRKRMLEESIGGQWKVIDAEIARHEERKVAAVTPIPADLMEVYEKLRSSKEGVAIARLEGGVCGGCHMALSPAERAEALSADPPRCVHCRRILVA